MHLVKRGVPVEQTDKAHGEDQPKQELNGGELEDCQEGLRPRQERHDDGPLSIQEDRKRGRHQHEQQTRPSAQLEVVQCTFSRPRQNACRELAPTCAHSR